MPQKRGVSRWALITRYGKNGWSQRESDVRTLHSLLHLSEAAS
jgi:hypothetical protein